MMGKGDLKLLLSICFVWIIVFAAVFPLPAHADGGVPEKELEGFDDSFDDGFDKSDAFPQMGLDATMEIDMPRGNNPSDPNSPFYFGGFLALESEYGFNKKNERLSMLTPSLFVETGYKINENLKFKGSGLAYYDLSYDIENKIKYEHQNQDDEKYDLELRDFYFDSRISDTISLKLGRQIIAWGESDYARLTDVINPRDLRQPGLIDLEDARLPIAALRVSAFFNSWTFDGATLHEHPGNRISGKGSDFDYYASIRNESLVILNKNTPSFGLKNTQVAVKATRSFNGGDLCFVFADTFDQDPYLSYEGLNTGQAVFVPLYARYKTYGISGSMAQGPFLLKGESVFRQDRTLIRNDVFSQIMAGIPAPRVQATKEKNQMGVLAGVEYTDADLRISFEGEIVHTLDHTSDLVWDEDEYRTYFQATYNMLNDTLALDLFWITFNPGQGNILRLSTIYDIMDGVSIQAGVAFYDAKKDTSRVFPYKNQDRLFCRLKYSF